MVFGDGTLEADHWFTNEKKKKKMGKVKFGQMLKIGSKHAGVDVLFVITYHPKCKKIAQKARAPIVSGWIC